MTWWLYAFAAALAASARGASPFRRLFGTGAGASASEGSDA